MNDYKSRIRFVDLVWGFLCVYPILALNFVDAPLYTFDVKRLLQVGMFSAALIYFAIGFKARDVKAIASTDVFWMLLFMLALGAGSTIFSNVGYGGRVEFAHICVLVFSVLFFAAMLGHWESSLLIFCACSAVASGVYAFKFFVGYYASLLNHLPLDANVLYFNVSHVRFYNQYQVWIMPILYWYAFHLWSTGARMVAGLVFVVLCGNWVILLMGSARGALLVLVISASVLSVLVWRKCWRYLLFYWFLGGISVLVFLFMHYWLPMLMGIETVTEIVRTTDSGRGRLWGYALDLWVAHPLFGVGNGGYALQSNAFLISHPHNLFFQYLAEWGVLSFLLLCGLYAKFGYWVLRYFPESLNKVGDPLPQVAVISSLMGGLMYGFFSGVFIMPLSQAVAVLVLALFASMPALSGFNKVRVTLGVGYRVLVIVLMLVWCAGMMFSYAHLPGEDMLNFNFAPRLWHIGYAG